MDDIQIQLFNHIGSMFSEKQKMVEAVAKLLDIKPDSTYRRIRGETRLSIDEIQKLCDHFNLSMDEILNRNMKQNILFQYSPVYDIDSYTGSISQQADNLHNLRSVPGTEMLITAEDIPFYHFMNYPELAIFRVYAWYNTQNRDAEPFCDFYGSPGNDEITGIYKRIYDGYVHIPAKEVWTPQTIDTTLRMLEYYHDTKFFTGHDTALRLAGQLMELIDTLQKHAVAGHRGNKTKTPFTLYRCHVDVENDFVMLKQNGQWSYFTKLHAINGIITVNTSSCDETRIWIENLILKSTPISGNSAEKEMLQFFDSMKNKVKNVTDTIKHTKH